ncbi:MAG: sel1 repeat family protein [Alphaproteobacteria bacterium]|nr:sel1 repeat family protein [Alphaproteobacteria bacterium]
MRTFARLALAAIIAAAVPFAAVKITALAEQTTPPPRSEGEDLYRRGNYPEALAWWTERAAQGDIESARRLGIEYMDGKRGVVERDFEKARRYHLQAAMGGESRSMMDLGTIHENGYGVPESLTEAARWYEWSAKYGFGPGQYNFALMLETGEGGRKDEVESYMYYVLAALDSFAKLPETKYNLNNPPADSAIGQLHGRLTPAQRAEARARAKTFKPLTGPLPASKNH